MEIDDSVGIDISKDFLDIHRLRDGKVACFPNGPSGFRSLSKWLGRDIPTRVIFEATGPYHRRFELAFSGKLTLVKVNPLQARRFAQACGTRVKTDAVDDSFDQGFFRTFVAMVTDGQIADETDFRCPAEM